MLSMTIRSAWRHAKCMAHVANPTQVPLPLRLSSSISQATTPVRKRWLGAAYGWGLPAVAGATFLLGAGSIIGAERIKVAILIPTRLFRDVWTAAAIVADYKYSLWNDPEGEERERIVAACHQRGADRLLQLCFANGGVYTKLGQHVGQLDHLLPDPYVHTMRNNLLNRCPVSTYKEVRAIITKDLGAPPETLFAYFNPNPIASASLAQVHVAQDHEGRKVAVKVQHTGLRDSAAADIATVSALVQIVKFIFPEYDYTWLVNEIKHNLPCELDFTLEARNAERCKANLNSKRSIVKDRIAIPEIYHNLTSPRVLTMEFMDGVPVTDIPALRRLRVAPGRLSRLISEAFGEMIFFHGFVHADPHAANMLVRKHQGRMQLVLLDHGLYREIDDTFRMTYAELWKALVFGDIEGIKKCAQVFNAGDMVPLFAGMLTQRPWSDVINANDTDHLVVRHTVEHKLELQRYATQYSSEIARMLLKMPRELLLLLKTNDCLRSVDNCLGQPVNNIIVTARECTRALAEHRLSALPPGPARLWSRARGKLEVFKVELALTGLQLITWISWLRQCMGLAPLNTGGGLMADAM